MANNLNLTVGENDIQGCLEVVTEKLTNGVLWELEWERTAEEEAREMD